jgi:RimJ/RimL family protein N-acetyltransferase
MRKTGDMVLAPPRPDDIVLRAPAEADAHVLAGWALSAEETMRWCSLKEHPVSSEVVGSWWEPPDVEPYVAVDVAGVRVAYGELWLDTQEDEVELARLIVAPTLRGQGVGRRLVAGLVSRAWATGLGSVILRVSPGNPAAVRCYRASGFRKLDSERNAEWNKGQPTKYTWMELR